MDVDQIKQRQAMIWAEGDYSVLSEQLRPAALALRDLCAVSAGQEVLDVGAGDGNFALACAQEGASVVASDLSPGMVERGRARAAAEGYDIEWLEADAEELPFEDERFDCVGSVFGAMIAPRPERAAAELFRVVRPGGTVGMTAWRSDSLVPKIGELARKYSPAVPAGPLPEEWGEEETARDALRRARRARRLRGPHAAERGRLAGGVPRAALQHGAAAGRGEAGDAAGALRGDEGRDARVRAQPER